MAEKQFKSLQNLMKTLPDYKQFFEEESYEDNLRDYIGNIKRGITYRKKYEKFRMDKSND